MKAEQGKATKDERIEFAISGKDKNQIWEAAARAEVPVSQFVRHAALSAARAEQNSRAA